MREKQELKASWKEFISRCPFEWFVTLTFPYPVSSYIAKEHFLNWVRSICLREHLQVAAVIVYNDLGQGHLHLMMLGHNQRGKTLGSVSMEYWRRQWSSYKWGCVIEQVNDLEGAAKYLVKNMNLYKNNSDNESFYNIKLLKKVA